jgi:predicted enzyme related to lactoylglutathione lyase
MRQLIYVVIFTGRFTAMKDFYQRQVGLSALPSDHEDWLEFNTAGARIALHRMEDPKRHGMLLRFESADVDADFAAMSKRGLKFVRPTQSFPWGRFAEFLDSEDNPVGLLRLREPRDPDGHVVDRVVVNCVRFSDTVHFYREKVGLKATIETDRWVEFDTGVSRLALHPRRRDDDHPPHTEQDVTVVFGSEDLMAWVERMREQDVHFATSPIEEDFGLYAEATDPDGYMVVFREPPPPATLEEELAEAYEEEDAPHQIAIRKPAQKPSKASGVIAGLQRRSRREAEETRRENEVMRPPVPEPKKLAVVAPRGTGPAGARQKPKTTRDPKRAKAKPAIGGLKEAERKTISAKKRAVAKRSKATPVKGAAKRSVKRAVKRAGKAPVRKK